MEGELFWSNASERKTSADVRPLVWYLVSNGGLAKCHFNGGVERKAT